MTAPIFKATFSDFKSIKTRGVYQFIFEVPVDKADAALDTLGGVPKPAQEVWVGIALLDPDKAAPEPAKPVLLGKRRFEELPLVQQAVLRCQEMDFREFLRNSNRKAGNAEEAAEAVRIQCGVKSRADLLPDTQAGNRWLLIESAYRAWKAA